MRVLLYPAVSTYAHFVRREESNRFLLSSNTFMTVNFLNHSAFCELNYIHIIGTIRLAISRTELLINKLNQTVSFQDTQYKNNRPVHF